jgi:hypothetical protein
VHAASPHWPKEFFLAYQCSLPFLAKVANGMGMNYGWYIQAVKNTSGEFFHNHQVLS